MKHEPFEVPPCRKIRMLDMVLLGMVGFVTSGVLACSSMSKSDSDSQDLMQHSLMLEESGSLHDRDAAIVPERSNAHYYFILGELALAENKLEEAEELFEKAAEYDESAAPSLRKRLVQLYIRDKKLDRALEQLEQALGPNPENIELLKLKAGVLATLKRNAEAIEVYKQVIALGDTGEEEPHIFAASLYLQDNNLPAAREILKGLIKTDPESFFANYYLARIEEADANYSQAEKYYLKAVGLSPQADAVRLDLARMYGAQKRFEDGIALCEGIVQRDAKNIDARNLLAQLHLGKNDVKQALQQFEALKELQEDPSKTRLRIALIKLQEKDYSGAEVELNLVLVDHPESSQARYYLSSAYSSQNKVGEALEQIKMIQSGEEYFLESRTLAVFLLRQAGRLDEALQVVDELLKDRPNDVQLLSFLAGLQKELKRNDQALKTLNRVIELEPQNDQHRFTLGVFFDENDQKDLAITEMRKAIELNPKNANAMNYLGYTFAELGQNLDEAESLIKRALEIEKDNGFFVDSLGWVYYKKGKYQLAIKELERAVKLVPNDAVLLEHLGMAYLKANQEKKAIETWRKAQAFADKSDDKEVGARLKKLIDEHGSK